MRCGAERRPPWDARSPNRPSWSPTATATRATWSSATTTTTGLTVRAELDTGTYEKGIKISDKEMKELEQHSIRRDAFHGEWNYALLPAPRTTRPTSPN
jgi:hypothetical protein